MKEGKLQAALNLLTRPKTGGILGLNDMVMYGDDQMTVRDILSKKHPPSSTPPVDALLPENASPPHEIIWAYLISGTGRDDPGKSAYLISGMAGTITEILTCLKPGITEIAECLNPRTDVAPPSKRWKCASAKQVLKLGAV